MSKRLITAIVLSAVLAAGCAKDKEVVAPVDTSTGSSAAGTVAAGKVSENQAVTAVGSPLIELPKAGIDAALGQKAPALSGFSFDGTPVEVKPGSKATLLVFLAHWCPHCQREVPLLTAWIKSGKVPANLDLVAVSTAVEKSATNYPPSKWLAKEGWTKPVMADDIKRTASSAYGLTGFPYFVLIKADGTVVARQSGEVEISALEALVARAL